MNNRSSVCGRFAPSPTGRMHLGNVFSALLSWLSARAQGGTWLLRIEDIDPQRSRHEYADMLMDDLQWLGLEWDGKPCWQSQRGDIYARYLQQLTEAGLIYPCYCTRADILATQAPHESDGRVVYKGTCRNLPPGTHTGPAALRMKVPDEGRGIVTFTDGHYGTHTVDLTTQCGDFIVRRKDGAWAYQLAVVVDDIEYPDTDDTESDGKAHVLVSIYVERDSQKPIIIGHKAEHLVKVRKKLRTPVNRIVGQKAKLDLHVKVAKDWQSDPKKLERLGF